MIGMLAHFGGAAEVPVGCWGFRTEQHKDHAMQQADAEEAYAQARRPGSLVRYRRWMFPSHRGEMTIQEAQSPLWTIQDHTVKKY